ncbi:hypothetical protein [uncultured Thiohalocapsa sp.]|uniref:hypothetical protein n=1 Tax=uncultured Thiohalocapsa sp. TaxID=768990 RepID=UPI0025EF4222|nr:hypothetical protein [uncultured Thiohalocapsa sp.]
MSVATGTNTGSARRECAHAGLTARAAQALGGYAAVVVVLLMLPVTDALAVQLHVPIVGMIGVDMRDMDADGLVGPPGGQRALDYEFCIPAGEGFAAEVRAIDDSARFHPRTPGRIGCGPEEVLVLGNTRGPDFAVVLRRLADLPYVERIERAWFE